MFTEFIFLIFSLLYGENIVFIFVPETMLLGSFCGCNVMRYIRNILEQLEDRRQFSFELSSRPQPMPNGGSKEVSCYILTKKDCLLLASGYDANLRAKIINRWEELEENKRELSRKREKSLLSKI